MEILQYVSGFFPINYLPLFHKHFIDWTYEKSIVYSCNVDGLVSYRLCPERTYLFLYRGRDVIQDEKLD